MDRLFALRLLMDIADKGSFSAVARAHAIAASKVTLVIQQLESSLGARLITRTTRKLAFTHEGERLLSAAREIFAIWETAAAEISPSGDLQGPIRITVNNDFGHQWVLPILDPFMQLHPKVQVTVLFSDGIENLLEQQIDVAIRSGPLEDSRLKARLLVKGRRVVCAAPSYWAEHGKPTQPQDLARHNCLVLLRSGAPLSIWNFVVDGVRTSVKVSGDRVVNDGAVLRQWAVQGKGVIVKNEWDIQAHVDKGELEVVLGDAVEEHVDLYAVYPKDIPNRRTLAFIDFLSRHITQRVSGERLSGCQPFANMT
ncbi:HTH-type transcriptional regulator DmlR [compost metagenome]|uniref:LysR family transcriptional regulator n=1 Tax=Pseudomonas sp. JUb96 TaxID=2940539 RepID=UPI000FA47F18|nr:LysR family transcriptional regulator [Pseudomonas sp. JUb96]